ncbi:hypothetical protein FKM82_022852 [Ascaphus truei]
MWSEWLQGPGDKFLTFCFLWLVKMFWALGFTANWGCPSCICHQRGMDARS